MECILPTSTESTSLNLPTSPRCTTMDWCIDFTSEKRKARCNERSITQVRSGPGSKFEATGVIGANEEVIVIQEGLMECDLKLVENWMKLHLPKQMVQSLRRSNWEGEIIETLENFDKYIESMSLGEEKWDIETYINETFDEHEANIFRKALAAANQKVKVMYKENGTTKYGWISKRKNSGDLITRLYGKSTPKIVVSGVETQPNDSDFARPEECER